MRSWLSVLITDAESKKVFDIPIAPSLYSLSNKMDNSLLAVRDINHKYIVVEKYTIMYATDKKFKKNKKTVNVKATTTARTIKRLKKGKTYYFKIQYMVKYKADNGTLKSVQSAWSKAKKVKIKK